MYHSSKIKISWISFGAESLFKLFITSTLWPYIRINLCKDWISSKFYTLASLLHCAMKSNVIEVDFVITFALCEEIQCQESLTLLSLLYCVKSEEVQCQESLYNIVITFFVVKRLQCRESLSCYHFCILQKNKKQNKNTKKIKY